MLDVTDLPPAQVGDEVVLFGEQGGASLTLEEVARGSETLPYEVMCTIGKRVTRIYVRDGRPVKLTTLVGERAEWLRTGGRSLSQPRRAGVRAEALIACASS